MDATIEVTANPSKVNLGQSSVVSWSVVLPDGCENVQIRFNGQPVARTGSQSVTPSRTSMFTVVVSETRGWLYRAERSQSAQVEVSYPSRVVIDPSIRDPLDPVEVLIGALESPNGQLTVELCDVDLDLTGYDGINIGNNRSLIASPSCARSARALGPRIFVTNERGRAALFVIRGDNVRISGFRLQGPTDYIAQGDRKEKGIVVSPLATDGKGNLLPPIQDVEICNMEIFHWSGVGVQVQDNVPGDDVPERDTSGRGRLFNTNPDAVRVKRNYFHHNQHGAGEGYGVNSSAGGYVTIEQNVFDENRHAIAGNSKHPLAEDYSGYTARENLILAGGGVHCLDSLWTGASTGGLIGGLIGAGIGFLVGGPPGAAIGAAIGAAVGTVAGGIVGSTMCWQTHQIDMHGTKDGVLGQACCGTAGETIIIERNTILYDGGPRRWLVIPKGNAIKIRGNPIDKAVVDGNVFKHESEGDAIAQNGEPGWGDNITNPIDVRENNVFNCGDLTTELGHGDFADEIECGDITPEVGYEDFADESDRGDITPEVGDGFAVPPGQQDDFMATGVTWWARSRTTGQWRYLNTMKERLPELQLGRFDDDDIWDVAPRTRRPEIPPEKYSKSGTSPWRSRSTIHP